METRTQNDCYAETSNVRYQTRMGKIRVIFCMCPRFSLALCVCDNTFIRCNLWQCSIYVWMNIFRNIFSFSLIIGDPHFSAHMRPLVKDTLILGTNVYLQATKTLPPTYHLKCSQFFIIFFKWKFGQKGEVRREEFVVCNVKLLKVSRTLQCDSSERWMFEAWFNMTIEGPNLG